MKNREKYRPYWVEPDIMKSIGYELVSDNGDYLKYENLPGLVVDGYGIMPKGKRIIYFNCEYNKLCTENDPPYRPNVVYVGIHEDGDSRCVFSGVCDNFTTLNTIHKFVR